MLARLSLVLVLALWPSVAAADESADVLDRMFQRMQGCLPGPVEYRGVGSTADGQPALTASAGRSTFTLTYLPAGAPTNQANFRVPSGDPAPLAVIVYRPPGSQPMSDAELRQWREDTAQVVGCFYWTYAPLGF